MSKAETSFRKKAIGMALALVLVVGAVLYFHYHADKLAKRSYEESLRRELTRLLNAEGASKLSTYRISSEWTPVDDDHTKELLEMVNQGRIEGAYSRRRSVVVDLFVRKTADKEYEAKVQTHRNSYH